MSQPADDATRRAIAALPAAVEDAVLAALELDDPGRDRVLAELLRRLPAHAAAIRQWLHSAGAELAAEPAAAAPPATGTDDETCDPPRRIGRYRIVRQLGRGGFGTVYLAEADGLAGPAAGPDGPGPRPVALKILNPGMDSREVLRRFAAEREALHRMDHPGIARLLDAGETATGRPFFVLEYVPGDSLALHCRRRALPLHDRLDLFLAVIDAIAHAHQKGVLHRDLSSNNVLVTEASGHWQPKIIDFGVAKSLAKPLQDGGTLTFAGTLMGTPEYMSPEQAKGLSAAIDTRTDIYSLGVQLYELLCDQLPIPAVVLRAQGLAGMAQAIATHAPARPSQVAPRQRQAALRGDLDWISLKAIAKERDERYASANEFATDLRRHLAHQPVLAGPPSTWYLLRKFARRNRASVAAALVLLLLTMLALLAAGWQWLAASNAHARLQTQHERLQQRADFGFRLLAIEQRLAAARAETAGFEPPWPDRVPAMRRWLDDHGALLDGEVGWLRSQQQLATARDPGPASAFADPADAALQAGVARVLAATEAALQAGGLVDGVRQRLHWATTVAAPAFAQHRDEWQRTALAIKRERGWLLEPQPGLVPLGQNPRTRLWEFLDLCSHPPGAPLPQRDAAGVLRTADGDGIVFVLLPAGPLRLGAQRGDSGLPRNDPLAEADELRGEAILLGEFFAARTELTVAQWQTLGLGPAPASGPALPATGIDWESAIAALRRFGMTLPTEAQWEYACRAGTSTPWCNGDDEQVAARAGNFGGALQPVGRREPNAWGLFDLHGNAAEWCLDWKLDYGLVPARNGDGLRQPPTPMRLSGLRVVRGGSAAETAAAARSAARSGRIPQVRESMLGLRPIRPVRRGN